mmetsp:Transcript_1823/g.3986  ORF Transcript_1823/g.3986 Transcript_1823/m.3986 type:complete len:354 (+) Transcript_1823:224-1285(+)
MHGNASNTQRLHRFVLYVRAVVDHCLPGQYFDLLGTTKDSIYPAVLSTLGRKRAHEVDSCICEFLQTLLHGLAPLLQHVVNRAFHSSLKLVEDTGRETGLWHSCVTLCARCRKSVSQHGVDRRFNRRFSRPLVFRISKIPEEFLKSGAHLVRPMLEHPRPQKKIHFLVYIDSSYLEALHRLVLHLRAVVHDSLGSSEHEKALDGRTKLSGCNRNGHRVTSLQVLQQCLRGLRNEPQPPLHPTLGLLQHLLESLLKQSAVPLGHVFGHAEGRHRLRRISHSVEGNIECLNPKRYGTLLNMSGHSHLHRRLLCAVRRLCHTLLRELLQKFLQGNTGVLGSLVHFPSDKQGIQLRM